MAANPLLKALSLAVVIWVGAGLSGARSMARAALEPIDKASGAGITSNRTARDGSRNTATDLRSSANVAKRDRSPRLSDRQRQSIHDRLATDHVRRPGTDVDFDHRVGASVPREVTLFDLPADVVRIAPRLRAYRYVSAGDDFIIADPGSNEIVAILSGGSGGHGYSRGNDTVGQKSRSNPVLTAEQRAIVREHVDRASDVRLGLGDVTIGMDMPSNVEPRPLPFFVVERIPTLRDYVYFVHEDEIAIVDPQSQQVVLVIGP